jgi:glycine/D-amino acid oxidase-like deaminating enzyme
VRRLTGNCFRKRGLPVLLLASIVVTPFVDYVCLVFLSRMDVGNGEAEGGDTRLVVTSSDVDRLCRQLTKQCPPFLSLLEVWGGHLGGSPSASS